MTSSNTRDAPTRTLLRHPFLYVVLAAALIRFAAFAVMIDQHPSGSELHLLTADTRHLYEAGTAIREHFDFDSHGVRMFGPGYPVMLAAVGTFTAGHPAGLTIVQIMLGTLGTWLLCLLALRLSGDRRVATLTGILYACSLSSIGLSVLLLSDTLFFVLLVSGLLVLVHAIRTERWRHYALAGLLFGLCALTRSLGQFLFLIVLTVVLGYAVGSGSTWSWNFRRRAVGLLVTLLVSTATFMPWIARNQRQHGMPHLAKSAVMGQAKLASLIRAEAWGSRYESEWQQFLHTRDAQGRTAESSDEAFAMLAPHMLWETVKRHPLTSCRVYLDNAIQNAHTDWGVLTTVFPRWDEDIRRWTTWGEERGLMYRTLVLALLGALLLLYHRQTGLLVILGTVYLYFMLMSGFTVWQGNRIFHPAILAWGILVSIVLVEGWDRFCHWRRKSHVLHE